MKITWLARFLLPRLLRLADRRPPDFLVIQDDQTYMRRWWIVPRNQFLNIYLHNMLRDDDDILHDHPYSSVSLVLTDGLREIYNEDPPNGLVRVRYPLAGDVIRRSSRMAHSLKVDNPAWTLFVTGPRVRDWGFWCPKGWRRWQDYVSKTEGTSKRGRGCGEHG